MRRTALWAGLETCLSYEVCVSVLTYMAKGFIWGFGGRTDALLGKENKDKSKKGLTGVICGNLILLLKALFGWVLLCLLESAPFVLHKGDFFNIFF